MYIVVNIVYMSSIDFVKGCVSSEKKDVLLTFTNQCKQFFDINLTRLYQSSLHVDYTQFYRRSLDAE